jgi:hypothetical protein
MAQEREGLSSKGLATQYEKQPSEAWLSLRTSWRPSVELPHTARRAWPRGKSVKNTKIQPAAGSECAWLPCLSVSLFLHAQVPQCHQG